MTTTLESKVKDVKFIMGIGSEVYDSNAYINVLLMGKGKGVGQVYRLTDSPEGFKGMDNSIVVAPVSNLSTVIRAQEKGLIPQGTPVIVFGTDTRRPSDWNGDYIALKETKGDYKPLIDKIVSYASP